MAKKDTTSEDVVLDHIADGRGGVVKLAPPLDAELFSHRGGSEKGVFPKEAAIVI